MSGDAVIFWAFVAAWAIVGGLLLFGSLPRIVAEVRGIIRHIGALVDGSPLPLALAKAETDAGRIESSLARIPALRQRAVAALGAIQNTPFVPPALPALAARIALDLATIRLLVR